MQRGGHSSSDSEDDMDLVEEEKALAANLLTSKMQKLNHADICTG